MKFEVGEIVELDREDYTIVSKLNIDDYDYIYLVTVNNPSKIKIGKLLYPDIIEAVTEKREIERFLKIFTENK